jgi:hypothetical protein
LGGINKKLTQHFNLDALLQFNFISPAIFENWYHITLYYGENFTVVRNLKDELKTGTYKAMLKQLDLSRN